MKIDDIKEKVSGAACQYLADLLEGRKLKFLELARLASFLHTGVEGAEDETELRKLGADIKMLFPELPEFKPGV